MAGKKGKQTTPKSQTPQPKGVVMAQSKGQTPKSAPPAKRKKLVQELDEEISDGEFEEMMIAVRASAELKKTGKHDSEESDEGDSEEEDITDDEDGDDFDSGSDDDGDDDVDDDDDDDESDNMEDEESDEDDEEVELNLSKAKLNSKMNSGNTPDQKATKGEVKAKQVKSAKGEGIKKGEQKTQTVPVKSTPVGAAGKADIDKLKERDIRTLFIKGFPDGTTEADIRDLSKDIIEVRTGRGMRGKKHSKRTYAFLEFKSEQMAEKNHKLLASKTVGGCKIHVDFVGVKSAKSQNKKVEPIEMDPLKLYVSGFGVSTMVDALKKCFPKSEKVDLPDNKRRKTGRGFAFVHFTNIEDCKAAHDSSKNLKIDGNPLTVMFAKKRPEAQKRKAPDGKKQKELPAKKKKGDNQEKQSEVNGSSDDEEDEDEDDISEDDEIDSDDNEDDDDLDGDDDEDDDDESDEESD